MTTDTQRLHDLIERYFDEADVAALDQACALAATTPGIDLADLLAFVGSHAGERSDRARALRRLRAALGLPPMPGPACRPNPFD